MKPRASMPTTGRRRRRRSGRRCASTAKRKASGSPSSGVMSRNVTPGRGVVGDVPDVVLEPARVGCHHSRIPPRTCAPPIPSGSAAQRRRFLRGRGGCVSDGGLDRGRRGRRGARPAGTPARSSLVAGGAGGRAASAALGAGRGSRAAGAPARRPAGGRGGRASAWLLLLEQARIGVATKIDEYEPASRPTSRARAKSSSATAPSSSSADRPAARAPAGRRRGWC